MYDIGDLAKVSAAFTNAAGAAIDPTVVKLTVKKPDGTLTTYTYGVGDTIVKDSTGNYHANIDLTLAGTWRYRWFSTGTGQAAEEDDLFVQEQLTK